METKFTSPALVAALLLVVVASRVAAFETVVIDPGHGGNDEGTSWHHVNEKDATLAVARKLEEILQKKGVHTVLTRHTDTYVSLDERVEIANRHPHSLLVSIHFNGSVATNITGYETYFFSESPSGKFIAGTIQDALEDSLPTRNRGIGSQNFAVLVHSTECAVLVECGFLSNKSEAGRFGSPEGQQMLAEALALGIMRAKPVINCDPPDCELAKRIAIETRLEEKAQKTVASATPPTRSRPSPGVMKKKKKKVST